MRQPDLGRTGPKKWDGSDLPRGQRTFRFGCCRLPRRQSGNYWEYRRGLSVESPQLAHASRGELEPVEEDRRPFNSISNQLRWWVTKALVGECGSSNRVDLERKSGRRSSFGTRIQRNPSVPHSLITEEIRFSVFGHLRYIAQSESIGRGPSLAT